MRPHSLVSGRCNLLGSENKVLRGATLLRRGFVFWLLQWFMPIMIWALYTNDHSPSPEVLAAIDFFGVANLGFFFVYAEADTFQWPAG